MTKAEYAEYLLTPHWQELKSALYTKRGKCCLACGSKRRINAHHVFYRDPITNCTEDDLMPLCRTCHEIVHQTALHSECAKLSDNDARRLHLILGIQAIHQTRKPSAPKKSSTQSKRRKRKQFKDRKSPEARAARIKARLERKKLHSIIVDRERARYAIRPGSPADVHQRQLTALKLQRQEEDRQRVLSSLKNSTAQKITMKEACQQRYIDALNRNGLNVKPTCYY